MKIWKIKVPPKIHLLLWKLEMIILPTTFFLRDRMHTNISALCKFCNPVEETSNHIFWHCNIVVEFRSQVVNWWRLDRMQTSFICRDFWTARKIFSGAKLKGIWNIVLSTGLWTLWIGRNKYVFQGTESSTSELEFLLKIRSFKSFCRIHKDLESLWRVNAVGSFLLSYKKAGKVGPLWWNIEIIDFSDGSCNKIHDEGISSGILGILIDNKKKAIFSYYGNSNAMSLLKAESNGIFLYYHFKLSPYV